MAQDDIKMTDGAANSEDGHRYDDLKRTVQEGFDGLDRSIKDGILQVKGNIHNELETQFSVSSNAQGTTTMATYIKSLIVGDGSEVYRAKEAYNKLQVENEQLKKENEDTWMRCETLASRNRTLEGAAKNTRELESQLSSSTQETKRLQEQNAKFREIILSNSSSDAQIVDEFTIIHKFTSLREQIQRLVLKFYRFDHRLKKPSPGYKPWTTEQDRFFRFWRDGLSEDQLKRRMRAKMFNMLATEILCRPLFGLDDDGKGGNAERGLESFEVSLKSLGTGNEEAIAEWRTQTLKCAKLLDSENRAPKRATGTIYRFMAPALLPVARTTEDGENIQDQCREHILSLCSSAYDFVLLLRSSKDTYQCECPKLNEAIDPSEAEPQDDEDLKNGAKKHTVIVALSDALVKYPEHSPRQKIVLEKAHVIIQG